MFLESSPKDSQHTKYVLMGDLMCLRNHLRYWTLGPEDVLDTSMGHSYCTKDVAMK